MAFFRSDGYIGGQNFADTSTVQNHALGVIADGIDSTLGGGEFIYLLGVASTVIGSLVTWHPTTYQTALAPVGNNIAKPVGVAMSANVAAAYGWYQVSGIAVAKKTSGTSFAAGVAVGVKTIGLPASTGTGKEIQGAVTAAAAASGATTVSLSINRPQMQGRVT